MSLVTGILRRVLRLGRSGRARPQVQTSIEDDDPESLLGPWERKVIAKYGADSQKPKVGTHVMSQMSQISQVSQPQVVSGEHGEHKLLNDAQHPGCRDCCQQLTHVI